VGGEAKVGGESSETNFPLGSRTGSNAERKGKTEKVIQNSQDTRYIAKRQAERPAVIKDPSGAGRSHR